MMTKKIYTLLISLAVMPAMAQDSLMNHAKYQYYDTRALWFNTDNAAGLALDKLKARGKADFDFSYSGGNLHRVQEGTSNHQLKFFTESYQQISKHLVGYGKFNFNMGRIKERAWADVIRPYNSNPFFGGSAIKGRYDYQDINLTAAVGTTQLADHWHLGAKLDYDLGDLSRLKDPRSRARLLNYKLTPSIIYSFGNNNIGVAGWYNRRKEKINGLTTVQQDATLVYYIMSGLENANGSTGGYSSFNREWVNHNFGAELSYGFDNNNLNSLTSISIQRGSEGVYGTYKYEPGHYYNYIYGAQTQNRIKTESTLHLIDLKATYEEGYADEYRQQMIITTDPNTGINSYSYETQLLFNKRYQVKLFDANFHYRFNKVANKEIPMFVGILASLKQVNNKYLLNTSTLKYSNVDVTLENGWNFSNIGFSTTIQLGYNNSTKSTLELADPTTDYAQSVLIPDMDILGASYAHGYLELMYQRPISIKGMRSNWFIKGYGNLAISNKKINDEKLKRYNVGLSIGVFY